MPIQDKIARAQEVLSAVTKLPILADEYSEFVSEHSERLFKEIAIDSKLTAEGQAEKIEQFTIGILILAIAAHEDRHNHLKHQSDESSHHSWSSEDNLAHDSAYYPKTFDDILTLTNFKKGQKLENLTQNEAEILIGKVTSMIVSGNLPLVPETLKELVEKYTEQKIKVLLDHPDDIAARNTLIKSCNKRRELFKQFIDEQAIKIAASPYPSDVSLPKEHSKDTMAEDCRVIQTIFKRAIDLVKASDQDGYRPNKQVFIMHLEALRKQTIDKFWAQKPGFDFVDCHAIAISTKDLAQKVAVNTVAKSDVDDFIKQIESHPHTADTLSIVLAALIGTVLSMLAGEAMLAGASVGFALGGGIPGAIILGAAGLCAGSLASGAVCAMFYSKATSLNQASDVPINTIRNF